MKADGHSPSPSSSTPVQYDHGDSESQMIVDDDATSSASRLPPELVDHIIQYVGDQKALRDCRLVSHAWDESAAPLLFRAISLDRETGARFVHLLSHAPFVAGYVRKLSLSFPHQNSNRALDIAQAVPTLERLEFIRTLVLRSLVWSFVGARMRNMLLDAYADSLRALVLADCVFPTVSHVDELINAFRRLTRLSLGKIVLEEQEEPNWEEVKVPRRRTRQRGTITTLEVQSQPVSLWWVLWRVDLASLQHVRITRITHGHEKLAAELVSALGNPVWGEGRVEKLSLEYADRWWHEPQEAYGIMTRHLNFASLHALRELELMTPDACNPLCTLFPISLATLNPSRPIHLTLPGIFASAPEPTAAASLLSWLQSKYQETYNADPCGVLDALLDILWRDKIGTVAFRVKHEDRRLQGPLPELMPRASARGTLFLVWAHEEEGELPFDAIEPAWPFGFPAALPAFIH